PKQAEVFVDGYYAGRVDDFDGMFQRLHTDRGEHDLTLYLDGYHAVHQKIYLQPNKTFRVQYTMEQLRPGETQEGRPVAPAARTSSNGPDSDRARLPRRQPSARGEAPGSTGIRVEGESGTLSLRVQPGNAEVRIDGERWDGSLSDRRLVVQLTTGSHR